MQIRNLTNCEKCVLRRSKQTLVIPSKTDKVSKVRDFIKHFTNECQLNHKDLFDLQVAVGEAVANAIEHGSPCGEKNCVKITAVCNLEELTVFIEDEGVFKRKLPSPEVNERYRGRGILLMLALMDRVVIDKTAYGTRVILTKQFTLS
jgi:anti-sigma regulatory factor (Ser/Thr protein kinase)